ETYGMYLVPFALCSLILSLIVSGKCGFFANFVLLMMYFLQSINWQTQATVATESYFYLLFGGVVQMVFASYILGKDYRRLRYVSVGLVLGLVAAVSAVISYIMFQDEWNWVDLGIKTGCAFASGIIGIMLMFIFVPVFEKLFKVTSVFRFSEIASSDNELMRKLFEKAPGTYNHSLTVATYVEACAMAIGQSAVMARAAAYYHDIGKMRNPSYFSENQLGGVNPHDSMTPEASVNMIKLHTANGLAIAKEYDLPKEVQAAIMEHHGTMPLKYFYLKAQKYTDGDLPYDGYCYDGPKPTSKISAILMICDASEAALRASGDKSKAEKIVDGIVNERIAFEQFSECDITMKEIDIIKSTIITTFLGIRHKRVKYPDVKLEGDK
ncbi:MAG: HDIG domain-containing metalloprotein, partial [Candidatus Fimimonas sp.]